MKSSKGVLIKVIILFLIFSITMPSFSYADVVDTEEYLFVSSDTTISTSETVNKTVVVSPNVTLTISANSQYTVNGNIIIYGTVINKGTLTVSGDIYANNYNNMFFGDQNNPAGKLSNTGSLKVGKLQVKPSLYPEPFLSIQEPINGSTVSTENTKVQATSFPGLNIEVNSNLNSGSGSVDSNGYFQSNLILKDGWNDLTVTVTDPFGNKNTKTISVQYVEKQEPPVVIATFPADQSTDIALDSNISVTYSESIVLLDSTLIGLFKGEEKLQAEIKIEDHLLKIVPVNPLENGMNYRVVVGAGAISDDKGNIQNSSYSFNFTAVDRTGTSVSGGIYEDTIWTKEKSPYIITGNITVFPAATLTIEPGVKVKFATNVGMTVRGKLVAEGTETEKITFTSEKQVSAPDWKGIFIDIPLGGAATWKFTEVFNAITGLDVQDNERILTPQVVIESSTFRGNTIGINSSYGGTKINNSSFISNKYGVSGSANIISSLFDQNEYGATLSLVGYVYNSTFQNNEYGITNSAFAFNNTFIGNKYGLQLSMGQVRFNHIEKNDIGIEIAGGVEVKNNEIIDNDTGIDYYGSNYAVNENTIQNRTWNVKTHIKNEVDFSANYWGTTDESVIKEKIYDGYDDINLGLAKYVPFLKEKVNLVDTTPPGWAGGSMYVSYSPYVENGKTNVKVIIGKSSAQDNMAVKNYKIYMNDTLQGAVDATYNYGESSFVISDLQPGVYKFKVEAGDFEGNWTIDGPETNFKVPDMFAPVWPSGSEVKITEKSATSATLEWTPASDNVKVYDYRIYINNPNPEESAPGARTEIVSGDTTSFKLTSLEPGKNYEIRVEAMDANGNQTKNGPRISFAALMDVVPPKWPENAAINVTLLDETSVSFYWPQVNEEDLNNYKIYKNGEYITSVEGVSYYATGLSPDTQYTFEVKATDHSGNVSETLPLTVTTPDYQAPLWPEASTLTTSDLTETSVELNWPSASDNVRVTNYRITINGEVVKTLDGSETSFLVTGLAPKTKYELRVEAGDARGNWSTGLQKTVETIDRTAPFWDKDSILSAYTNSEMEVDLSWTPAKDNVGVTNYRIKQDGKLIANLGESNYFRVTGLHAKTTYEFTVEAGDSSGNWSSSVLKAVVTTKDLTAPDAPIVNEVNDQSNLITGKSEPGTTITVGVAADLLGTGTTGMDGNFAVTIPKQNAGTLLWVIASDEAGNSSEKISVTVQDKTSPSIPAVMEVTDQSTTITGTAEAYSMISVKVNQVEIGKGKADINGIFNVTIPLQTAGTVLEVTATDGRGNTSLSKRIIVKDVTPPDEPLILGLFENNTLLKGTAEPGSVIRVRSEGMDVGNSIADLDGNFSVTIPIFQFHVVLDVTATDKEGNISGGTIVMITDINPPDKPAVNEVTDKTTSITGTAEESSKVEVKVKDVVIGTGNTGTDGKFSVDIIAQKAGMELSITASDKAENISVATNVVVKDATVQEKPLVNKVNDKATSITGSAEANSKVEVKINGQIVGAGIAGADGKFTISIPVQKAGTVISITAMDKAGFVSKETTVVVMDESAPETPIVNQVSDKDTKVAGQAEADAKVEVKANGIIIGTATAGADGKFTVAIPVQKAGTEVEVTATDKAGNVSGTAKVVVKDVTAPELPSVNPVTDKDTSVVGKAEVGSSIEVKVNGMIIGTATAGAEGKFTVIIPVLKAGVEVEVTSTDKAGNISGAAKVVVKDVTVPELPSVNPVTDKDTSAVGKAEAGSSIEVKANGMIIGTATVGADGKFTVTIPVQKAETELAVTATDKAGNVSAAAKVMVKDVTAPGTPTVAELTDLETVVKGTSEPNATVIAKVSGVEIGRGVSDGNGNYSITIPVQQNDKVVEVYAVDKAGNVSTAAKVTVQKKLVTLIGDTRYATAAKVSQTGWETAESVLLVNGFAIVDGLTATPLAAAKNAPILLTTADSIPQVTLDELTRLKTKEITLIGGEAVISPKVESMLKAKGYKVTRIGGLNRKDTSLLIAKELDKLVDVNSVYVAYAFGEPDALSISAQAGLKKQPIILVDKTTVPTETLAWLKNEQLTNAYFIGGEAVIASAIINQVDKITTENVLNNRLSGADRHETNAKVISKFYPETNLHSILVTKSETVSLVDALTAGPLAAKLGSPVVLVSSAYGMLSSQKQALAGKHSKYVHQIGGGVNQSALKEVAK